MQTKVMIKPMRTRTFIAENLDTSLRFYFRSRNFDLQSVFFMIFIGVFTACLSCLATTIFASKPSYSQIISSLSGNPIVTVWMLLFVSILCFILIPAWIDVLWRIVGKEVVEINEGHIAIRHQVLFIRITKTFRTPETTCIVLSNHKEDKDIGALLIALKDRRLSSFERGKLAFNYGKTYAGRTHYVRFGPSLDREEMIEVADIIYQKFPQYKCSAKSAG